MGNYLYTSMVSASQIMRGMADVTHNLANASTTGFRADLSMFKSLAVPGAVNGGNLPLFQRTGVDTRFGPLQNTGVDLDVAVSGEGWMAVTAEGGGEAYTRRGDLRLDTLGQLTNGAGQTILGDGGPLAIPPHTKMEIAADGTISIQPLGQGPDTVAVVGRIKLVSLDGDSLYKGKDGLLRLKDGAIAQEDANISLVSGALEASNVNTISTMVRMIELQRSYETLHNRTQTIEPRVAGLRIAAGTGFQIKVLANGLQTGGVDEICQLQCANLRGRCITRRQHRNNTVGANSDCLGILRNRDRRLNGITVGSNQLPVGVESH